MFSPNLNAKKYKGKKTIHNSEIHHKTVRLDRHTINFWWQLNLGLKWVKHKCELNLTTVLKF